MKPVHPWLRNIHIAVVPGPTTPLLKNVLEALCFHAQRLGHHVQAVPDNQTDVILTTAPFGKPLPWRDALLFSARRRFALQRAPTIYTLIQATQAEFHALLEHLQCALAQEPPNPSDFALPGLAPQAHRVLVEQGRRGGPILALERVVQAQAKCIRVLLIVGDEQPVTAYHFDLAGGHPQSPAKELFSFYEDILLRIATTVSTEEVTEHQLVNDPVPQDLWEQLRTPATLTLAARELGQRGFFTDMVRIADLVQVPAVDHAVASQYSEGCFSTWEPTLGALLTTVTGSLQPIINKGCISDQDLVIVVGIRSDGQGTLVRPIEGKDTKLPSSEAMEMSLMDRSLPKISLGPDWGISAQVPVARSKLHGHRGVRAYDPHWVEYVPLDPPYYHYPVSCATAAQAQGVAQAFARSEALRNPADQRQLVFTILPGHGVVLAEKWVLGKQPFQLIWEYMDAGTIEICSLIPQGPIELCQERDGKIYLNPI